MCGIAGYIAQEPTEHARLIARMSRTMAARGPDDEGFALIDPAAGRVEHFHSDHTMPAARIGRNILEADGVPHQIALAHRRFGIVDPGPAGHQPFASPDGRATLAFNGELYNHVELRAELERAGRRFVTRTDTEVMLAAYEQWGESCFDRFRGFWAMALYDARTRRLLLSRDRLGKAPLYLSPFDHRVFFASEIKALRLATMRGAEDVDEQAAADYVYFGWRDLDDRTFFRSITTFPAASFAWVATDGRITPERYWSLPSRRLTERAMPVDEAADRFRATLVQAMDLRLRADVPVGIELSGGLDSSTMVALAARSRGELRVFTASFAGCDQDEAPFARRVVEHLKAPIELTPIRPADDDFWLHADRYVAAMDEPIHAVNTFTYHQVWRAMAERGLRVSISGAAADELLAGYRHDYYRPMLRRLLRSGRLGRLHREIARLSEQPAASLSAEYFARWQAALFDAPIRSAPGCKLVSSPGSAIHQLPSRLDPMRLAVEPRAVPRFTFEQALAANMGSWRMNYWLRVAHQSAMSVPMELRLPFLDHHMVELAFTMPATYLIRDGYLKWIMRRAMDGVLPDDICWRPRKWGFRFPYSAWSRTSQERFWSAIGPGGECPLIDTPRLRAGWNELADLNPIFLWRVMNLMLWWKRCVMGKELG